jgi:GT2 family glycosyltransferase
VKDSELQDSPRVFVIIATWNKVADVLHCVGSLRQVSYPSLDVVVVDNGSQDGTSEALRQSFPEVEVLRSEINLGYAGGYNLGIRRAVERGAEYVLLLNNDSEATPELVGELVRVARTDPRIAVVGARNLLMADQSRLWGAYGVLTWGAFLVRVEGQSVADGPQWRVVKDVDWIIGNGCLWSAKALKTIGLLDERFFAYHEDVDWSIRARRCGYRVVFAGTAALVHKGSSGIEPNLQESVPVRYFLGRNSVAVVREHARWYQRVQFGFLCGVMLLAWFAKAQSLRITVGMPSLRARGNESLGFARTYLHGVLDGLRGAPIPFQRLGIPQSTERTEEVRWPNGPSLSQ